MPFFAIYLAPIFGPRGPQPRRPPLAECHFLDNRRRRCDLRVLDRGRVRGGGQWGAPTGEPRRSWQARCRSSDARPKLMPRTADFRVLASLDLDVLGCPDFGAALARERKLVAARHALVAVRGGLIAVEVRCRETADQNDGVEHDRFIYCVDQPRPATLVRRVELLEGLPPP